MRIDADVMAVAKDFGLDPSLLQAVVHAEGNIVRAVQSSIPTVKTRALALRITARSCVHAMSDWIRAGGETRSRSFITFWGARWAPIGAVNDPSQLNANWAANVERLWRSPLENQT